MIKRAPCYPLLLLSCLSAVQPCAAAGQGTDCQLPSTSNAALLIAVRKGDVETVAYCIAQGAHVNTADQYGKTPLHCAAENGHEKIIQLLLEQDVDVNTADKIGRTPLHWAAEEGHAQVVKLLLEKGVNVNAADHKGRTALTLVLRNFDHQGARLLLEAGAQMSLVDRLRWLCVRSTHAGRKMIGLLKHTATYLAYQLGYPQSTFQPQPDTANPPHAVQTTVRQPLHKQVASASPEPALQEQGALPQRLVVDQKTSSVLLTSTARGLGLLLLIAGIAYPLVSQVGRLRSRSQDPTASAADTTREAVL